MAASAFSESDDTSSGPYSKLADAVDAWWRPAAFLLAVGILWWLVTAAGWVKPYLIPSPDSVAGEFRDHAGLLAKHSGITLLETVIG
ncbi:MAG: hypothetical protein JO103_00955, partial [Candidatus Eremiobacteraeota bacterium]|nr:hypothetical protein [Candidatus Eremiobacteraeota bacterium]